MPVPLPCPRTCYQDEFSPELVHEISEKYGLPPDRIFYYRRKRDYGYHRCPLRCGRSTMGTAMGKHLQVYHPGIDRTTVTCSVRSRKGKHCLGEPVDGATYLQHFEHDHFLHHSVCAFCLFAVPVSRMKKHFDVCPGFLYQGERRRLFWDDGN
ncbi:uncharacterized protein EV420DRAFT_1769229 [Desarmillaria tabescens]|uniref:Uncharacterized protein n=1 Tax=Armillaria tabescens TaxID=1929756 RepID=A0AA39JFN7_ARMTA|nr:uncharacterized protein EV420DRAFT_1769229 [Desarmillaria tabescens]KAK0440469.1 hypothetical protein EV420DRAFT_1769229 [Desarmillaria tabescens]